MKIRLISFLLIGAVAAYAQNDGVDFSKLSFRSLGLISTKEEIIKSFGRPGIADVSYECGAFTNDQPGAPYYLLDYRSFNYIGSDTEKFTLHKIEFDAKGVLELRYVDKKLNGFTTRSEFVKIFGDIARSYFRKNPHVNSILLYSRDTDDGIIFTFENNRLVSFEYWTPC